MFAFIIYLNKKNSTPIYKMKNNLDDLTDDELFASYDAFKALIDAGLSKDQALERTGLTAQIVKDFEAEE